ncbi:hypothetical protein THF5H11_10245 [Vibrio jasicida]|nr:hypothetical protein THF5H11_10245 [Vibrio jasicida]
MLGVLDLAIKYLDNSVRAASSQNYTEFLATFAEGQEHCVTHCLLNTCTSMQDT